MDFDLCKHQAVLIGVTFSENNVVHYNSSRCDERSESVIFRVMFYVCQWFKKLLCRDAIHSVRNAMTSSSTPKSA